MGKALGIDYGTKRTGIAITDEMHFSIRHGTEKYYDMMEGLIDYYALINRLQRTKANVS